MSILQHALWLGYGNRDTFRGIHREPLPENRKKAARAAPEGAALAG